MTFSVAYFAALTYLLFFAFFRVDTSTAVNFIPGKSILVLTGYTIKTGQDWWHWFVNVPGNVIAFMPMAVPLVFFVRPRSSQIGFAVVLILIPLIVEVLQWLFKTGSCDVDDIILNVLGMLFGIWFLQTYPKQPRD